MYVTAELGEIGDCFQARQQSLAIGEQKWAERQRTAESVEPAGGIRVHDGQADGR